MGCKDREFMSVNFRKFAAITEKSIMTDHEKRVTEMIKAKIKEKDPDADVILYGSHARGDANKDSDWDILILVNKPNFKRYMEREYRDSLFGIELEIEEPISAFIRTKEAWETIHPGGPFYDNVTRDGILL